MTRLRKALRDAKKAAMHKFKNPYIGKGDNGLSDFYAFKAEVWTSSLKKGSRISLGGKL